MKKSYVTPDFEEITFTMKDVLTASQGFEEDPPVDSTTFPGGDFGDLF